MLPYFWIDKPESSFQNTAVVEPECAHSQVSCRSSKSSLCHQQQVSFNISPCYFVSRLLYKLQKPLISEQVSRNSLPAEVPQHHLVLQCFKPHVLHNLLHNRFMQPSALNTLCGIVQ